MCRNNKATKTASIPGHAFVASILRQPSQDAGFWRTLNASLCTGWTQSGLPGGLQGKKNKKVATGSSVTNPRIQCDDYLIVDSMEGYYKVRFSYG